MKKSILSISVFSLLLLGTCIHCYALINHTKPKHDDINRLIVLNADTIPPANIMEIIKKAVYSLNNFDIDEVANLYTPNATIADDEPPYSWNGPTAGVQWVNAVERACKDLKLTKLKGSIQTINIFQQSTDNVYIVVPVTYTGKMPGQANFVSKGAFTFILRMVNGKWMIKSQGWMPKRGM